MGCGWAPRVRCAYLRCGIHHVAPAGYFCAGCYQQTAFFLRAGHFHAYSTLRDSVSGVPSMWEALENVGWMNKGLHDFFFKKQNKTKKPPKMLWHRSIPTECRNFQIECFLPQLFKWKENLDDDAKAPKNGFHTSKIFRHPLKQNWGCQIA